MNKPEFYKHLKTINCKEICEFIESKDINWNHKFNNLYGRKYDFINFSAYPVIDNFIIEDCFLYDEFMNLISEVVSTFFQNYGPGRFARIQIAKMNINSEMIF